MVKLDYNLIPHGARWEDNYLPIELCRDMTGSEKVEIAFELSEINRQNIFAEIRKEHPDYTRDMVMQAYLTLITDDKEFVKEAFGGRELQP